MLPLNLVIIFGLLCTSNLKSFSWMIAYSLLSFSSINLILPLSMEARFCFLIFSVVVLIMFSYIFYSRTRSFIISVSDLCALFVYKSFKSLLYFHRSFTPIISSIMHCLLSPSPYCIGDAGLGFQFRPSSTFVRA